LNLPSHLSIINGELRINNLSIIDLAEKYGTPLYIISGDRVKEKYEKLNETCKKYWKNTLICYAYKANHILALLKLLKNLGAGAEVVSGGELYAAKKVGVDSSKIVFNGVSKSINEIRMAIENKILLLNIENLGEIDYIKNIVEKQDLTASIGVRVNLDVPAETHKYISTGMKIHKFGLTSQDAIKAYKLLMKIRNVEVNGIHIHIGSQILSLKPFKEAVLKLIDFCKKVYDKLNLKLKLIDLGGGLGIPYKDNERELSIQEYCKSIFPLITDQIGRIFNENSTIILEPGRYLVGDAGILVSRVNYVKEIGGIKWILIDAGMNDLIRPALYNAFHKIILVEKANQEPTEKYWVGGPICESSDVFAKNYPLPKIKPGDLIAILNTGAYGISMSSQYNCRPRAPVIMIENGIAKLVRRRETYQDIFNCDLI